MKRSSICLIIIVSIIIISLCAVNVLQDLTGGGKEYVAHIYDYSFGERMQIFSFASIVFLIVFTGIPYLILWLWFLNKEERHDNKR
jgi:flagellar basal body-associated protein FliL